MQSLTSILAFLVFSTSTLTVSTAGLLTEPVRGEPSSPYTVPAIPVQIQSQTCRLDLSKELFGGVNDACGKNLDRSRCCPVLAAWLFAAHARAALEVSASSPASTGDLPMMPDDSQKCVNSLLSRNIRIPQPNASCDPILCFCGIRLHQITSLTCPAAFNVSASHNAAPTPTYAVTNLQKNCLNSSYSGCTKCLEALQKVKGNKNGDGESERERKMLNRDCELMGLTWLLERNKTAYIATVSAVLRAIMYSAHPHQSMCSPDQDNMPLAVDSVQFEKAHASTSSSPFKFWITVQSLIILFSAFAQGPFR